MATPVIRVSDPHSHGGGVVTGAETVFANGLPIARVGDAVWCNKHKWQTVATGSPTVFAEGQQVARVGDITSCGAQLFSDSNVLAG